MNENLKGIFSALSPARRSFINERLLAKAASDTELLASYRRIAGMPAGWQSLTS